MAGISLALLVCAIGVGALFSYLTLLQNGRMLVRLDAIERELVLARQRERPSEAPTAPTSERDAAPSAESLLAKSRINRDGLAAGVEAPDFSLPRLDEQGTLSLREFRGTSFLLVFASADCAPCDELARRLASAFPSAAERILVVAHGTADAFKRKVDDYDLLCPVVVQRSWEISRLYGTFKMPSAYAIDEKGCLTSGVVVGAEPILELARLMLGTGVPATTVAVN